MDIWINCIFVDFVSPVCVLAGRERKSEDMTAWKKRWTNLLSMKYEDKSM